MKRLLQGNKFNLEEFILNFYFSVQTEIFVFYQRTLKKIKLSNLA